MQIVSEAVPGQQITATTLIDDAPGVLVGIFVSAASATPTITVYDTAAADTSNKLIDTFTPVAGQYYAMPFACKNGCRVVISGTVSCTVGFRPTR